MYDDGWFADLDRVPAGDLPADLDWSEPVTLPDTIELQPPGPQLAVMLAEADRSRLSGSQLVVLAQARARQLNHLQASLMADLVAIADRCIPRMSYPPLDAPKAEPVDHAEAEIAAAMTWTAFATTRQLDFAERLILDLPDVHAAMLEGRIDWPRAKVLADGVAGLDPDVAGRVLRQVLPGAPKQTTGQVKARLAKLVGTEDPEAALRRYRAGLRGRRLEHGQEGDGTASLAGRQLPAARAAAANARIGAIATWIKDGGDPRTLDQIRADILLDLLQGLPVPGPDGQDDRPLPGDVDQPGTEEHPSDQIDGWPPEDDEEAATDKAKTAPVPPPSRRGRRVGPRGACPSCGQTKLTRGLELTAPITTLIGLSQAPGQLGSWGPVIAETARALVADLIDAPWRISLTDEHGRLVWHGPVRRRPDPDERRRFPTPTQAAHVRARDRRCRFPGCRRPAARAELDHTLPHAHDGPTHECNLQCLCVRHHVLKSAGLWIAHQTEDGQRVIWTSALGRTYITDPEPIDEPQPVATGKRG